ncbi:MAG: CocE/NonD family hydrolase [Halorubrum sp.]|uniref:CocE/NonD family hydrolase n=1 Tax=Halorubrum sp. TaxID=1879286 RepID=UPI003970B492
MTGRIARHEGLRIPVGDETVSATRYEPVDEPGPSPALLSYVPYPQQDSITYGAYDPLNRYLAARGYEVIVADMVGTGGSTGFIDEPFTRREGREPAAIVEWLADRAWTTGRIGMFGKSYGGITALDAAAQRPDALEAIVPIHTPFEGVRNAYTYGGLFELLTIGMDWLTLMQALDAKPPSDPAGDPASLDAWLERLDRLDDRDPWLFQFLEAGPDGEYWADKTIPVERIDVPVLAVDGWRDPYTEDTLRYVDRIDAPTRVLLGPWRHRMPHCGRESAIDFRRQVADWFDRFLREEDAAAPEHPTYRIWTERNGGGTSAGCWRGLDAWPTLENPDADRIEFALAPGGLAAGDAGDSDATAPGFADSELTGAAEFACDPDPTVGLASVDPYGAAIAPPLANDDDARTRTFDTDPLERPVELTGTGEVELRVESPVPDPMVVVRLVDVDSRGRGRTVTSGAVRGAFRDGLDSREPLPTNEEAPLAVALEPTSHLFEAGHRIRVAIGTALFPEVAAIPDPNGASADDPLTVRSSPAAPSRLRFPGRRHAEVDPAFADAIQMAEPDEDRFPARAERATGSTEWETSRAHVSDRVRAVKSAEKRVDLPHGAFGSASTHEATVDGDDPASVATRNEHRLTVENDLGTFLVEATSRISPSGCRARTTVSHEGTTLYEGEWTR